MLKKLMFAFLVLSSMHVSLLKAETNTARWEIKNEGQITAEVIALGGLSDNLIGWNTYTAKQEYSANVNKVFTYIQGFETKESLDRCGENVDTEIRDLDLYPKQLNGEWIKFRAICRRLSLTDPPETLILYYPYTPKEADKVVNIFKKSKTVTFMGVKISAKGYTKAYNELKKAYGVE